MWRAWAVFGFLSLVFGLIIVRLFWWQVVRADQLRRQAASQYFIEFTLPATRGSIVSFDGSPLVMNQPAFLIFAEPRKIEDDKRVSREVASLLDREEKEIEELLTQPGRVWVPLARKVEASVAEQLESLNLSGIGFEKEPKRYYPEASTAAHLLGFVGSDVNGQDRGYFGLEGNFDRELRGQDGVLRLEKDAHGAPILIGEAQRIDPEDGRTLILSLDRVVQQTVEKRLLEGIKKYGAKEGSVIVLDPKNGTVLAMASFPNYDPGNFTKYDNALYKNPVVAGSYEPGSTFKVLVMAGALNEKLVTPTTTMEERGPVTVGEHTIRTWNNEYHGTITMMQVLEYSSNVGMVFVARQLGKEKLFSYLKAFGLGVPTGIDLEEETSPELRPDREWRDIDLATASFGQGIAVTPIQMVRAVAAFANGGWVMEPRVVKGIRDRRGKTVELKPRKVRQVISEATASIITEMMVAAVEKGEAKWAKPKGYRIAGKTGTAQIPVAGHYDEEKTIASFIGFAPADHPRFVMLVTLREPSSSPWGSETAAPLFFTIAHDLFAYWGISP